MKYKITIIAENEHEADAIINSIKNKAKLDGIYDEIFRKHIKYETDYKYAYEIVWSALKDYLEEN